MNKIIMSLCLLSLSLHAMDNDINNMQDIADFADATPYLWKIIAFESNSDYFRISDTYALDQTNNIRFGKMDWVGDRRI